MKTLLRILGGSTLVFLALIVALFLLHPRIPLGIISHPVSSLLTFLTGSEQIISGNYFLVPGTWTTFSIENGSVKLTGKDEFLLNARINTARTTVHLWSLLSKGIKLDGIAVHGVTLDIQPGETKEPSAPGREKEQTKRSGLLPFTLQQTGLIDLADITAAIALPKTTSPSTYQIITGKGEFSRHGKGSFTIEGMVNNREFRTDLTGGPLADLSALDSDWPFSIRLSHKSVAAEISGHVSEVEVMPVLTADLSLSGEHFDDLVWIIGRQGSRDKPFALQGTTVLSGQEFRADFRKVQMGSEILTFSTSAENVDSQHPHYQVIIKDDSLDLDAVKAFITPDGQKSEDANNKKEKTKITRDDKILPDTLPIRDLAFDLDLGRLVMAGKEVKNIQLDLIMKDGSVTESPFTADTENTSITGHFSLDFHESKPKLAAHLETSELNMGEVLSDLNLAKGLTLYFDRTRADLHTRGQTTGELFDNLTFEIEANNGAYEYQDPNTQAVLPVDLDETRISAVSGDKIEISLQGDVHDNPIAISMELDDRRDEQPGSVKEVPLQMHLQVAGLQWDLSGQVPLHFRKEGITLHSRLRGERLDSLNDLLQVQLPEIGPYEVNGRFSIVPEGYNLNDIHLQVGSSLMDGNFTVNTKAVPPEVTVDLQSSVIQLNDFRAITTGQKKAAGSGQDLPGKEVKRDIKKRSLTDREVLNRYNASIQVSVDRVLSGEDHMGKGTLRIEQKDGSLKIDPLDIQLPNGDVNITFTMKPSPPDHSYKLNILVRDLDYGIVGRWFKPDTDMSGIINLRTVIESESPDSQNIMANGSGYFDFSIQPSKLRAGVLDLWSVNLFNQLIPFLTPKGESKINCAAGRLNLENGILKQEELLIDTSKIRVNGTVEIDFHKQWINAMLRPIPKRPQFFSLSTPIEIDGSFSDVDAGITTGGVVGTVIRLATSYIAVPLQWIIQNKLPEDGTEACLQLIEERTVE